MRQWTRTATLSVIGVSVLGLIGVGLNAGGQVGDQGELDKPAERRAKNVILFIGDGMGVSTVTATRVYSVGVAGQLAIDQFPYTALSRTYAADSITPDSAPTMTAMMTGRNTNGGVLGLDDKTEVRDFNRDGDGESLWTLLEQAKQRDMRVGVVSTARITHATPAATFAHINNRDNENAIALQALPGDSTYNQRLEDGIDVLFGGGRQFFVPTTVVDEEGGTGSRTDGRDLRAEYAARGYSYVWNTAGFNALRPANLPVLGLFERSHMEYEYDRATDSGTEPSLTEMTLKSIALLSAPDTGRRARRDPGFFLMVEGGRIDHAHHEGNALRALTDAEQLDRAIGAAVKAVDLRDTLIIVSADHSHVFNIAGYPLRPLNELPYPVAVLHPRIRRSGRPWHPRHRVQRGSGQRRRRPGNRPRRCAVHRAGLRKRARVPWLSARRPEDRRLSRTQRHRAERSQSRGLFSRSRRAAGFGDSLGRGGRDLRDWTWCRPGTRHGEEHVHLSRDGQGPGDRSPSLRKPGGTGAPGRRGALRRPGAKTAKKEVMMRSLSC